MNTARNPIAAALAAIHKTGSVFEIRIPDPFKGYPVSGYFDDFEKASIAAAEWSGKASAVYLTLNPAKPDLLARAANRLKVVGKKGATTTDTETLTRRWLPIDFDPDRPSGISATDAEHDAALAKARAVRDWLNALGWPAPIFADSGNGAHLLYAIDLPNDPPSKTLIEQCLKALAQSFPATVESTTPAVKIDTGVFNAARIWKLYGTLAAKGDHTPERPHRTAKIIDAPANPALVTIEQMQALAALVPNDESKATAKVTPYFDGGDFFGAVNSRALAALSAWVPALFPDARPYQDGYRVNSKAIGRDLEEDLSILPTGIKDFGVADQGDARGGKRTPIDLVLEHGRQADPKSAALWLCTQLGITPEVLGWHSQQKNAKNGPEKSAKKIDKTHSDDRKPSNSENKSDALARHSEAAEIIFSNNFKKQIVFNTVSNQWLQYDERNGYFVAKPDVSIQRDTYQAVKRIGVPFDASYIGGVVKCLMFEAAQEIKPKVGKICFRNGVLDLKNRVLEKHSPVNHFTSGLPFDWTPDAEAPAPVIEWLLETCGKNADQVELIRAFINAVITGRAELQRFLELIGPGGGGKGTLIRLMTALVGKENVHATTLKQLEENRFESAKLFGKKLVIIGDAEKWHGDVSVLKAITGQDAIRFEQKHQQAGENFTYGGMVVIAANQHTESTDYSSGIQRRRITVPFEHVVPVEQRRDLEAEFEPYLPAVIKWALDLPQERVTDLLRSTSQHVASLKEARLAALAATNPIVAWLLESAYFDPEAKTQIGICKELRINEGGGDGDQVTTTHTEFENEAVWLYANYCSWCLHSGKRPMAKNSFAGTVIDAAQHMLGKPFVGKSRDNKGRYIVGIGLGSCRPMSTNDDLVSTQLIDCAEDANLDTFLNKNTKEFEDKPDTQTLGSSTVVSKKTNIEEHGGKSGGNVEGRHNEHNQSVSSTLGRHGSARVDINQPQDRHAATAAPSVTNPTRPWREVLG